MQQSPGADKMVLPGELIQRLGPDPLCKWGVGQVMRFHVSVFLKALYWELGVLLNRYIVLSVDLSYLFVMSTL